MRALARPLATLAPAWRVIDACPDACALYAALTARGARADTALLETLDVDTRQPQRSFIIPRASLRLEVRGAEARFEALDTQGARLLDALAQGGLEGALEVTREPTTLRARYPLAPREGSARARLLAPSPLDAARALVGSWRLRERPVEPCLLAAGVLAYDLIDLFEDLPPCAADPLGVPDVQLWLPGSLLVLDPVAGVTTALAFAVEGPGFAARLTEAEAEVEALARAVSTCAALPPASAGVSGAPPAGARAAPPDDDALATQVEMSDEAYAALVTRLKAHIRAGDVFQVVPSRAFSAPCPEPFAAYEALRRREPSPYMFHVSAPTHTLLGASPETCIKVSGAAPRRVEVRPIAGTAPRGRDARGRLDADLDGRLEAALRLDEKELAEHMMLIDLARNDVARVSRPGTRHVPRLLTVDRYAHVMHLVSYVAGELRDDLDALHAYAAAMNMGTLVGAPKLRAAALLREHERTRRGVYGGAVGYLTDDGQLDTAIIIRSALARDGQAHVRAGAGVVHDSRPEAEALETRRKARGVLCALAEARGDLSGGAR